MALKTLEQDPLAPFLPPPFPSLPSRPFRLFRLLPFLQRYEHFNPLPARPSFLHPGKQEYGVPLENFSHLDDCR